MPGGFTAAGTAAGSAARGAQAMRFTRSLRGRLAAYFAISIVITLLISGFLALGLVQRYLQKKTVSDLESQVRAMARQIEQEGLPARRFIDDLEKMYGTNAVIVPYREQALRQLPRSGNRPQDDIEPGGRQFNFLDWELLKGGGTQTTETELPAVDRDVIVAAHGIRAGGDLAGAVVLSKPVRYLQSWQPLALEFLIAAVPSLAVSFFISFLLARRLSRPLHEITEAATAVAAGDFSREVATGSDDEIGRLADAFRYMSTEVQRAQEQRRDYVINVSHELKTPLTAIAGHTRALKDGVVSDPEKVAKSLDVIEDETRRLSRLIEDLLSLAKFDARQFGLRKEPVDLTELVGLIADSFSREAHEKGVNLSHSAVPGLEINTDSDRLRQVLSNLAQNAIEHTPPGGSVSLTARIEDGRTGAFVEVADTGSGIHPGDLPHVFDRFYRSRGPAGSGLGLGLAISRELARALGGDVSVSSEPGEGTTFVVNLPL